MLLSRGDAYAKLRDYDRALADLKDALAISPQTPIILHIICWTDADARLYASATSDCSEAINKGPDTGSNRALSYRRRAEAYLGLGQPEQGLTDYETARRLLDAKPEFGGLRAQIDWELQDYEQALSDQNEAIRFAPNNAFNYVGRCLTHHFLYDEENALSDCNHALELDSKNAQAYINRGLIYLSQGDPEQAISDYSVALQLDDKKAPAYVRRCWARSGRGDIEGALADCNIAIQFNPKSASPYIGRALIYARNAQWDLANEDFDKSISLEPFNPLPRSERGFARFAKGDFAGAQDDFAAAVKLQFLFKDGYASALLDQFIATGRATGSTDTSVLAAGADRLTAHYWPAPIIDFYLGRLNESDLFKTAKTNKQQCQAHFFVGEWHFIHSKKKQARDALQTAANECSHVLFDYDAAVQELKRIDQGG